MPRPSRSASGTHKRRGVWMFGLTTERDYVLENIGLLIGSGLPLVDTLDALTKEMRSKRMQQIMRQIRVDVEAGVFLWQAMEYSQLFSSQTLSLIRLGEQSGNLVENLKVVALEQEKDRQFRTNIRSAVAYPVFVLLLTIIVGVGVAWFILPKLALVFSQLHLALPPMTKMLITVGGFFGRHGAIVVPLGLGVLGAVLYLLFSYHRTKYLGRELLVRLPGIGRLLTEVELARFGYLLGTLLEAGVPIVHAFDSLTKAAGLPRYQKLYRSLGNTIADGQSMEKSIRAFPAIDRTVPTSVQFMLFAGERSGTLATTLLKIGRIYDNKSATSAKDIMILLEPILLVVIWLGVVGVALAVIVPLYSLIGSM